MTQEFTGYRANHAVWCPTPEASFADPTDPSLRMETKLSSLPDWMGELGRGRWGLSVSLQPFFTLSLSSEPAPFSPWFPPGLSPPAVSLSRSADELRTLLGSVGTH